MNASKKEEAGFWLVAKEFTFAASPAISTDNSIDVKSTRGVEVAPSRSTNNSTFKSAKVYVPRSMNPIMFQVADELKVELPVEVGE